MIKNNYFLCLSKESNPNSSFTTNIGNNYNEILLRIENEIKKLIKTNENPEERQPYYFVANHYWRHKNA